MPHVRVNLVGLEAAVPFQTAAALAFVHLKETVWVQIPANVSRATGVQTAARKCSVLTCQTVVEMGYARAKPSVCATTVSPEQRVRPLSVKETAPATERAQAHTFVSVKTVGLEQTVVNHHVHNSSSVQVR